MNRQNKKISKVLSSLERVGVIGSPSSTSELSLDISENAVKKKLVGELILFSFLQEGRQHYALGQITEIELRNIWLEQPTIRSLARRKGNINPISEQQDTHLGKMTISAVFQETIDGKFQPSILGTIPATGTPISIVTDEILDALLELQKEEIFYLGNVYGSKLKLPLWFKHFGPGKGGMREALHIGIFGKTGSGKSYLAKMIMIAYARHPEMGIFVIDPQGEYARDILYPDSIKLPVKTILEKNLGREIIIKNIQNLVLDRWDLFINILIESRFFERIRISARDNRRRAAEEIERGLKNKRIKLSDLHEINSFEKAWEVLGEEKSQMVFYPSKESREQFRLVYERITKDKSQLDDLYQKEWKPIGELFNPNREGSVEIDKLVGRALMARKRPIIIFDLSKESAEGLYWTDSIQFLIIKRLLQSLLTVGEWAYRERKFLNSLVIIDEAHRLAPDFNPEDEYRFAVKRTLVDAARTTRKYGLGWLFISQTLASLEREIREQLRISFFGFGLSAGTEYRTLQELVGGESTALKLYRAFKDPQSAFDESLREYTFMTMGPVSPLSFAGTPLFLSVFTSEKEFLNANKLKI